MNEKKGWGWWLLLAAVIALAVTNPSEDAHRSAFKAKLNSELAKDPKNLALVWLGKNVAGIDTAEVIAAQAQYDNYIIGSTLTSNKTRVTIGILRNVHVEHP